MAGANLIYGAGMIESGVTFDCGQFVMDNEFARMIKHSVGGIPVDDETLAVEDIAAVGPFGDFLSLDATMRHMREQSQPEFLDRRVREDWESRGSSDLYQRCVEKAREVIQEHKPEPLPDDVAARIRAIVEETDRAAGRRLKEGRTTVKDQLKQAIIDGNADTVNALTQALLASGASGARDPRGRRSCPAWRWSASACAPATASSPRCCSARAPCRAPSTSSSRTSPRATRMSLGTVVIGTVEGDLHDIGKNLVGDDAPGRRLRGRQPRHRGHPGAVRRRGRPSTRRRSSA